MATVLTRSKEDIMEPQTIYSVLIVLVPVAISRIVAIVTSKQVVDLKDQLSQANLLIARLEQLLQDNKIPLPLLSGKTPDIPDESFQASFCVNLSSTRLTRN